MPTTKQKPSKTRSTGSTLMLPGKAASGGAGGRDQQTEALQGMLAFVAERASDPQEYLAKAATALSRGLDLEYSATYLAETGSHSLSLMDFAGLSAEFAYQARTVPLEDFADVADLPYNGDRPACYGDFFAAVAGSFGIRSWLVASLSSAGGRVMGAILLGCRDPHRMEHDEAAQIVHLAGFIAGELENRFSSS